MTSFHMNIIKKNKKNDALLHHNMFYDYWELIMQECIFAKKYLVAFQSLVTNVSLGTFYCDFAG